MISSLPAGNSRRRRRLKGPAQMRRSLRGLGGVSHQQASLGIYRGIACRYLFHGINRFAQFHLQSGQQVRLGAYQVHLQFSTKFQNLPACHHSQSSSDECGQFPQNRSRHLEICLFCCEDCVLSFQPHYCRIAPPHPAFSSDSVREN